MTDGAGAGEQLELLRSTVRGKKPKPPAPLAEVDPVARSCCRWRWRTWTTRSTSPCRRTLADAAVPGARCGCGWPGQQVEGFVVARTRHQPSTRDGCSRCGGCRRPRSSSPRRCWRPPRRGRRERRDAARRPAPGRPARNAAAEKRPSPSRRGPARSARAGAVGRLPGGPAFLDRVAAGGAPRAVWTALPAPGGRRLARAVARGRCTAASAGRGALVVLPDHRDVDRVCARSARGRCSGRHHVRLTADQGPAGAVRRLAQGAARAGARVVVGTRAAALAPVTDLGLVVCWDDGDDLHAEPHAPYWHIREVLPRAGRAGRRRRAVRLAFAGRPRCSGWSRPGWARSVEAGRAQVRERGAPGAVCRRGRRACATPRPARRGSRRWRWRTAREALEHGPVLVQVPRAGYEPETWPARTAARRRAAASATDR